MTKRKGLDTLQHMVDSDKPSTDVARVVIAEALVEDDSATDLSDEQVLAFSFLEAIQYKIKSPFLGYFLTQFKHNRKSLNRKSRKEMVDMFKSIKEEGKGRWDMLTDRLGMMQ